MEFSILIRALKQIFYSSPKESQQSIFGTMNILTLEGVVNYNKTKPMRFEEFQTEIDWWGNEEDGFKTRVENEQAWKVAAAAIIECNYNLDIKNPHVGEQITHDLDELLALYNKEQAGISDLRNQLKAILAEALKITATKMIDTIVNSFDIWVDAQGIKSRTRVKSVDNISLEGIKKLRSLILDFAIKGKLVPQNSNEESADVLLKKIVDKNKLLNCSGKFKGNKPFIAITEKEKTMNLPNGWAWARFGNISLIERGGSPRPIESYLTNDPDGLNWIKIGDTEIGGKYITSTRENKKRRIT